MVGKSNSKFLPYMIQMARHLLDQSSVSERRTMAIAISSYLNSSPSIPSSNGTEETVQLMIVTSLLTESPINLGFNIVPPSFKESSMTHTSIARVEQVTMICCPSIVRPVVVYMGLIEQLQRFLKLTRSTLGSSLTNEGTSKQAKGGGRRQWLRGLGIGNEGKTIEYEGDVWILEGTSIMVR